MCSPADVEELLRQIDVSDSSSFSDVFVATKVLRGLVGKDPVNFQPTVLKRQDFIVENFKAQVKIPSPNHGSPGGKGRATRKNGVIRNIFA